MSKAESSVEVDWVEDYLFLGHDEAGHSVVFDAAEKGVSKGISPMKALLTSLGACSGMDVVAILGKRKQTPSSVKVRVDGRRPEFGYPKPFTSITVRYTVAGKGLDRERVSEAVRESMEKYCSVAATLSGKAKIDYSYEVVEG